MTALHSDFLIGTLHLIAGALLLVHLDRERVDAAVGTLSV